jgi:hypothetical protein
VVGALAQGCDALDVCGTEKRVCLMSEIGKTYDQLQTGAGGGIYPAFVCGAPPKEPSCTPRRPEAAAGSTIYTGEPVGGDGDGDGIADADDRCAGVFDPVRPVDGGAQPDADGDGDGDACDPCPLVAGAATCTAIDPNDRDQDGVPNATDNCADLANPDQRDGDDDAKGDACDVCPAEANLGLAGCPTTIYKIKRGETPVGRTVRISDALVTGKGSNGFFVQVKDGDAGYEGPDHSGMMVFTGPNTPTLASAAVGARVTIDGRVTNFQGQLELDSVTTVIVRAPGPEAPPAPIAATYAEVKTGGPRAAALEGVIVSLGAASVTAVDMAFGEFTLTSGADALVVDDFLFASPLPELGAPFTTVTGILAFRQMASKLEPRDLRDLGPPRITSLAPALSYARVGQTADLPTFPSALTVTLSGPAQGDTLVTIASGDPAALTVTDLTIPDGQITGVVDVTAVAQSAAVIVTGSLGGVMKTATVRVLGAAEVPTAVTLSPAAATAPPLGTVQLTATLDVPAPAGGTVVGLAATAGTVPATVTVGADQLAATFTYTAPDAGSATVTATLGGSTSDATVTVAEGAVLVINEVDYDQIGADGAEYIEIYNRTAGPISLAGKQVLLVNGNNSAVYDTIDLSPAGTLPAGGFLVIANASVAVPMPALKIEPPGWGSDRVQNGMPDGIALVDAMAAPPVLIDALSYEGAMTMIDLPGFPAPVSLVEGTMLPASVADSNTVLGALCRSPNGQDTDQAMIDWKFCTSLSAGTANP